LDASFFSFRQSVGEQAIGSLAIASLLAKKVALRIKNVGLDVRVAPHGNFGADWETARNNAAQFNRVAKLLGIRGVCVLTDGTRPYQPFLGRGESIWALHMLLEETPCQSLAAHDNLCFRIASAIGLKRAESRPPIAILRKCFREHLEAQGTDYENFARVAASIRRAPRFDVAIRRGGFVTVDLGMLRTLLVQIQNDTRPDSKFPDPCGVVFRVQNGTYVWPGDTVASVRVSPRLWNKYSVKFSNAFAAVEQTRDNHFFEEVRNA
jgi:pyrimidine-nucleoside phosphorylase